MARSVEKTGKTIEEAQQAALYELGLTLPQVKVEVLAEPGKRFFGLMGTREAKVRVTELEAPASVGAPAPAPTPTVAVAAATLTLPPTAMKAMPPSPPPVPAEPPSESALKAEKFLRDLFAVMRLDAQVASGDQRGEQGTVHCNLTGENLGVLIGKRGQTLDALQYLTNLAANRGVSEGRVRIILDVEGYRDKREETLRKLAARLAEKVRRSGDKLMLEPMNRHERKVIHMALQNDKRVRTYSSGEEPFRKVVIEAIPKSKREKANA